MSRKERGTDKTPNYYDWRDLYPEMQILIDNITIINEESKHLPLWTPWPEDHYSVGGVGSWTVFPLLHTFPAYDLSKLTWIPTTCEHAPRTVEILKQIPNIRTALFSRLIPGTELSAHTGWEDLANHVLRCHLCLSVSLFILKLILVYLSVIMSTYIY